MPEYGYCWASDSQGYRCNEDGCKASKDYGFYFEHCYEHLGMILASDYPAFFE